MIIKNDIGEIDITENAIASLCGAVVSECYGIVGMASKKFFKDSVSVILGKENYCKGIVVTQEDNELKLDIYVIVMYGVNILHVVSEAQKKIKYQLEKTLNISLKKINIYVQGIRVID